MKKAALTINENDRLKSLKNLNILDTIEEVEYDDLTAIAAQICQTPIALISLIDENRQWFKSHHGLEARETPRDIAFCAHAILDPDEAFIIEDSIKDERFHDNPLVTGAPHVIFYAGIPLKANDGNPLGTLCVIDNQSRKLSTEQINSLKALGRQASLLFDLRLKNQELNLKKELLENKYHELEQFAYVVSHDLKSPLSNLANLTNILISELPENERKNASEITSKINSSTEKMKDLIEGLLNYYKCESYLNTSQSKISLKELISKHIELIESDKNINFKVTPAESTITSYKSAWDHIILNLLSNSVKFNDKENVNIHFDLQENDSEYKLTYIDNGQGIPKESQESVFKLFTSIPCRKTRSTLGSGIGLNAIQKLLNGMGGSISVKEYATGAKFEILLKK